MGFETFRVELRGGRASYREADEAIRKLPHAKPDRHSVPTHGSTFYLLDDGQHVIEVELMDGPVRLSCRFTLCHPPSVDPAFLGLVRELMVRLRMEAKICDDVRPEHAHSFCLNDFDEFSSIAARYIAARRTEWIAAFGSHPMAATTNEVYQRIIVPRCQPKVAPSVARHRSISRGRNEGPMSAQPIFMSHASADDAVVAKLRASLRALGVAVWTDSQYLSGGVPLEAEIFEAIEQADHFVALVSPKSLGSKWVEKEIKRARKVQKKREDGYKVIPILLDGVPLSVLPALFGKEPVAVLLSIAPGGVEKALPDLLAALGRQLPDDPQRPAAKPAAPVAELTLTLADPSLDRTGGKHRAAATAQLTFSPPDGRSRVDSRRYRFTAPLGPIEAEDLAWYLERYAHWPSGPFQDRARGVERKLPAWGQLLYAVVAENAEARNAVAAWQAAGKDSPRRFTVLVDPEVVAGSPAEAQQDAAEAATLLLGLPWELVHDGRDYLFQAAPGVHVRRRLPNREPRDPVVTDPPVRVLLVSPRPEDDHAGYLDHRGSARPVAEALAPLGELAQLTLLSPPTFKALEAELRRAFEAKTPYHVVHFDGHGVYDKKHGLGALCFEHDEDKAKLAGRKSAIVGADEVARVVQRYRVPLVFLDACQTAMAKADPTASVAGKLLQHGVHSVVAMSHSVLVETARRFVAAFYVALLEGQRVGQAMLAGQRALKADTHRGKAFTGPLHLQDWFVPVLFQEELDPQLIKEVPAAKVQAILKKQRELALGKVPPPEYGFVGRSRELLAAERLLGQAPYAVLRGQGGEGKTTLAAELARWLVATHRFRRAAFSSLETHADAHSVLFALGEQLVPNYVAEAAQDDKRGLLLVERALAEQPTLLVFDNMESVLPPASGSPLEAAFEPEVLDKVLQLCARLGKVGRTRLVFTSRERMPKPFDGNHVTIDRLDRADAVALVGKVLGENGLMPHAADLGESEAEIHDLVEAVNCHARSLVLLPREIVKSGVRSATRQLHELMAALHRDHPDDRERSLLASVELSLRRLPAATRQKIRPLGVFQGGGHPVVMAMVLSLDLKKGEIAEIAKQLTAVGLAEPLPYGYLQLNPALGPALLGELTPAEHEAARAAWAEATAQLTSFLYGQLSKDPNMAFTLALLDLANLLAGLEHLHKTAGGDRVVKVATSVEDLVAPLGRPKALARAAKVRAEAAPKPGEWTHAAYLAASAAVDRLLDAGRHAQARTAAEALLQKAVAAGENAYPLAPYDLATTHLRLGRVLQMGGDAEAALGPIDEARRRFEALAEAGNKSAARMASLCQTEAGDCLTGLGRLDEAAEAYEASIKIDEQRRDPRDVATGKFQLGAVRMGQGKYQDALATYAEARETFEKLGEHRSVAAAWHQIGIVHHMVRQYEAAERASQNSLKIKVQLGDRSGEASTLNELGNLYGTMGRPEGAVQFYRQAADIYFELEDLAKEGLARSNVANTLIKLNRHDEARTELLRAIECKKPFGHAAQPWKTFNILSDLERAVGNAGAASAARQQAVQAYLAYRRAGGESQTSSGKLAAAVAAAIAENQIDAAAARLAQLLQKPDLSANLKALVLALQAILAGARDPALAADPNLYYRDAAELLLLLESLGPAAA